MAVRIDIPGIGTVEAENAASEDTLRAILAAMSKESGGSSKKAKADDEAAKAAQGASKALKGMTETGDSFKMGWAAVGEATIKSLKTIGLTAVALATKFATDYANIAADPIKETAGVLNTLIDTATEVTTSFTDAIPIIGGFISAIERAGAELLKAANTTFANQMKKNVDALQSYAKAGVSFAGSMDEMNIVAQNAGLGMEDFTKIVVQNKEELNKLGMAGGEAAARLSGAMGASAKIVGKSGQTLRDEMFKMGYTYEEQGAVMTSFMANMQAAGKLERMSKEEIAAETRAYAKDLKVIADITGQDAKKLMERARAESMRGALMTKLQGDQKEAFMKANAVMAKAGPEVQAALTQYLTFGKITDPKIAANKAMVDMVTGVGEQIKAGNTNMADVTQREMSKAYQTMQTSGSAFANATDRALVAGSGGLSNQIAEVSNRFMAAMGGLPDPEAAKKSGDTAEQMATSQEKLATTTADLYSNTKTYQMQMEKLVNENMPEYMAMLDKTSKETQGRFMEGVKSAQEQLKEKDSFWNQYGKDILKTTAGVGMIVGGGILAPFTAGGSLALTAGGIGMLGWAGASQAGKAVTEHDKGGNIPLGGVGIVGENGPELVGGPASILSRESTANMEKFFKNMKSPESVLAGAVTGFAGGAFNSMQSILSGKSGMDSPAKATKEASDRTAGLMEASNHHLAQIVGLMEKTVNNTARVALNTN